MKALFSLIAVVTTALFAAPSLADTRGTDPQPATAAKTPQATATSRDVSARRYCVEGVPTGSIILQRECHTAKEWKDMGVDLKLPAAR